MSLEFHTFEPTQCKILMEEAVYHVPVLLKECVDGLVVDPAGTYADVTFGGGGHSRAILSRLNADGHLYGFDQDEDAEANIIDDGRFTFVRSNFRYLRNWMRYYGVARIDGLLADLGVSSHHFDDGGRGFSFRFDGKLDMRMNRRARLTAAEVVNDYAEGRLADIFHLYGELRNARRMASRVAEARMHRRIETTGELVEVVKPLLGHDREKKELTKVFQALRIEVNAEMDALKEMLTAAVGLLRPGGRLAVLAYHSLEDRMVKNLIKTGNMEGERVQDFYGHVDCPLKAVHNKVIVPGEEEQRANPRSRSAKLRIAEKR